MKKIKKIVLIVVGVLVGLVVVMVILMTFKMQQEGINILTGERIGAEEFNEANAQAANFEMDPSEMFTERDLIQVVDMEEARPLVITSGKDTVINQEGTYVVSGTYEASTIIVAVNDQEKVQLVFDGLSIENKTKPVILIQSGDKIFITTTDTDNDLKVTDVFELDGEKKSDGVIFSRSDLTLNGIGSLTVTSTNGSGIISKDDLKITGGIYNITAMDNGLEANDSIRIFDGDLTITSSQDAMHSVNKEDESRGYIYVQDGDITITAGDDAIRGNSAVIIDGGRITIETCKEGIEATQIRINDGEVTLFATDDGINATQKTSHRIIAEFNGGIVNVVMAEGDTDGIDSNGDFTMNGGEINVEGGMAAFDIDGVIAFNGGTVRVDGLVQSEIKVQNFGILNLINK